MVLCFRYSTVPLWRAALLSVVLRQAAEKIVPLVQPTAVGSNILERSWGDATNGAWYADQGSEFPYPQQGLRLFTYTYSCLQKNICYKENSFVVESETKS